MSSRKYPLNMDRLNSWGKYADSNSILIWVYELHRLRRVNNR